jgi:single-stranded-DNA-specific exonuclease
LLGIQQKEKNKMVLERRWKINQFQADKTAALQQALKIHPALCSILVNRGIEDFNHSKLFFRPQVEQLHDPFLMKDMQKAVDRIITAIQEDEKILIYGDYDVDGTTSVAIVYDFLCSIYEKEKLDYYIPNRYKEGYGLSQMGIDYAVNNQFNLLITLDCGIKSVDLIQVANEKNIDTIVCDHHLPGSQLPPALAILNAKQSDCPYPYKDLCACGVGFKLIQALSSELSVEEKYFLPYLELTATAIAADIVPITGENRLMAYLGIKQANENPSIGIKALIDLSKVQQSLTVSSLAFMIGPRINAAGRMDDAKKAVSLFIERDPEKAKQIALLLQTDNTNRREADASITIEAIAQLESDETLKDKKAIVVYNANWHKGVIGIVASRLLERYYKPTIVLTQSGSLLAGSARSIAGFNIHDGLEHCSNLLFGFGGHYFAAGMTLLPEHFDEFKKKFESIAAVTLSDDQMIPELDIHAEVELEDLTPGFYNILEQMEPFGPDNPKPVFCIRQLTNTGCRIVKEEHVRFEVEKNGLKISGIGFGMAEKFKSLENNSTLDIVFNLEENNFRDVKSLQLKVIDFDVAGKK